MTFAKIDLRMAAALVALGMGGLVAFGCSKDTKPSAEEPKSPAAAAEVAATEPASETEELGSGPAKAKFSEANFELTIEPEGAYAAGKEGSARIVLIAKDPFKTNDKYPYKFKLDDAAGVKFPGKVVTKDAVELEKKKAVMTVRFTPESKGKKSVSGQFSFSVCTEEKCLIEKRKLALEIDVSG